MDKIFGLPAHPLIVHIPIVFIPLVAALLVVFVARPQWRWFLSIPLGAGAFVTLIGVILGAGSGESLQDRVDKTGVIREHADMGGQLQVIGVIFGYVVIALVVIEAVGRLWSDRIQIPAYRQISLSLMVASLLMSAVATVWDVRTGHSGAKAVWTDREGSDEGTSGDDSFHYILPESREARRAI